VYGRSPVGVPGLTYRYPPILLLWFSLYLLWPPAVGFVLHTAAALCLSGVLDPRFGASRTTDRIYTVSITS
jgi:hypothetical protein